MRALCVLVLFAGGCYTPHFSNGGLECQPGAHPCPDGYHCAANKTCWKDGSDPDPPNADFHGTFVGGFSRSAVSGLQLEGRILWHAQVAAAKDGMTLEGRF